MYTDWSIVNNLGKTSIPIDIRTAKWGGALNPKSFVGPICTKKKRPRPNRLAKSLTTKRVNNSCRLEAIGMYRVQCWNSEGAKATPSVPNVAFSFGLKVFVVFSANHLTWFLDSFGFFIWVHP